MFSESLEVFSVVVARLRTAGCVFPEEEAAVLLQSAATAAQLEALVLSRIDGLPLEHVVGWTEFCGRRIRVDRTVFVPCKRTEHLAQIALTLIHPGATALDMCCGTGAIGSVLAAECLNLRLHLSDVDEAAVQCAIRNVSEFDAHVYRSDLFDSIPLELRGKFDVIVANAPYVPTDEIRFLPREARLFEPGYCLDGGTDGSAMQQRLAGPARHWLRPGGYLLFETAVHQIARAEQLLDDHGFFTTTEVDVELDVAVVIGRSPESGIL